MKYLFILFALLLLNCSKDFGSGVKGVESKFVQGYEAGTSKDSPFIKDTNFLVYRNESSSVYIKGNFGTFEVVEKDSLLFIKKVRELFQMSLTQYPYNDSSFVYLYKFNVPLSKTDTLKAWSLEDAIF